MKASFLDTKDKIFMLGSQIFLIQLQMTTGDNKYDEYMGNPFTTHANDKCVGNFLNWSVWIIVLITSCY